MIAPAKQVRSRSRTPAWHEGFLRMLPIICLHARVSFRGLDAESREEMVQNSITNAMIAYARLYDLGKVELAYPSVLGRYAVSQTREGRITGNHLCINDVSSAYAQRAKGIIVERLDEYDSTTDEWQEVLIQDRHCGPFDIVRMKLDFAAWLRSLPTKLRRIAKMLAAGETTTVAAEKFGLSLGRISQVRAELRTSWRRFIGDETVAA